VPRFTGKNDLKHAGKNGTFPNIVINGTKEKRAPGFLPGSIFMDINGCIKRVIRIT
jgi:hypothetical protein